MSANTAELTLILKARNLADIELNKLKASLGKVVVTAQVVARDMSDAFKRVGKRIAGHLGNLASDILSGGSIQASLFAVGATMAGAVVEGMAAHLIPGILAKVMTTAAFAPLAAAMEAGGITLGAILATGVSVGFAALPFILLAAAVAALIYLITNPEARAKAREVALMILGKIGDGLRALPGLLADIFRNALGWVGDIVRAAVGQFVRNIMSIPRDIGGIARALADVFARAMKWVFGIVRGIVGSIVGVIKGIVRAVQDALAWLGKLISTEKKVGGGQSKWGTLPGKAAGGWVGLHGPEVILAGERGPEFITPNHQLGAPMGGKPVVIQLVLDKRVVGEVVDERLYYAIKNAVPA